MTRPLPSPVPAPRGFTLIEMVVSMAIISVLLLACGSVVSLATRVTNDSNTRTVAQLQSADAADQIADDLNVATNFTSRTSQSVTFTVPDRLNSGSPQQVVYSWSGVTGDALIRQFNNGAQVPILTGVQNFSLGYLTRLVGPAPGPSEQVIFSHIATSGTANNYDLDSTHGASQYFTPSLPLGTASYTITRIRFLLKTTGPQDGIVAVKVCLPSLSANPTTTVLGQAALYESALSTAYEWVDVPFTNLSGLGPLQGLCVSLTYTSGGGKIATIQYDTALLTILSGADWSTTSNNGSTWTAGSLLSGAKMVVYATVP